MSAISDKMVLAHAQADGHGAGDLADVVIELHAVQVAMARASKSLRRVDRERYSPLAMARRFEGVSEVAGSLDNPLIMAMLQLDNDWPVHDETPWCSAFANFVAFLCGLDRSTSLMARSWLRVGEPSGDWAVETGYVVAVLQRGGGIQPGPDVLDAPGHVGFVESIDERGVNLWGGNQGNAVSRQRYPHNRVLGYRRLRYVG